MKIENTINDFIINSYNNLKKNKLASIPVTNIPELMIDKSGKIDGDWKPWKIIPSTVTDNELNEIENNVGLSLPKNYKIFLKSYHFYGLIERGIRFCRHPVDNWKSELYKLYDSYVPNRIIKKGYLPFGNECFWDAGLVCFDLNNPVDDNDYPIVFWDHEFINTDKEIALLFSNSKLMFESLNFIAKQDVFFFYKDEDDTKKELDTKLKLMEQFLNIDKNGAGSIARDYWTSLGVCP